MSNSYTEDHLVEQPAIQLVQHELGWDVVGCYGEWDGGASALGRDGKREVVLVSRLRPALQRLNPDLPVEAIEGAVEEICRDFFLPALSLAEANREIDKHRRPGSEVLFALEPPPRCNRLKIKEFLFEWKTAA
jgi:type I restriction enzyme R subunit